MKSTVPVGSGQRLRAELDARGLDHVGYVSNPEFLREGRAVADFLEPDRIVIGAFDDSDADAVAALYQDVDAVLVRTDPSSAEMIKYASNAFLATKISFINEIANVCEETGADVAVVAHAMGLDERIGAHFLRPGIGYGGSCLPGEEMVTVLAGDAVEEVDLESLFNRFGAAGDQADPGVLEVLAWQPGDDVPEFRRVSLLTRRTYNGEMITVEVESGARVRCTADHPLLVWSGLSGAPSRPGRSRRARSAAAVHARRRLQRAVRRRHAVHAAAPGRAARGARPGHASAPRAVSTARCTRWRCRAATPS